MKNNAQMDEYPLELKFAGGDIEPSIVRSRDIAEVIESFDEMLTASILSTNPDLRREDLIISFIHIQEGSVRLQFRPNLRPVALAALQAVSVALCSGNFQNVPRSSVKCLNSIQTFTRRYNCTAELRDNAQAAQPLASIDQNTVIKKSALLIGETTLFGEIIRAGGQTPRVMFRIPPDRVIYCDGSYEVTKQLGEKLYSFACLKGMAQWDPETLDVEALTITELVSSPSQPITQTLDEIGRVCRQFYLDIVDVPAYVSSIRGSEEGEL